MSVLSTGRLRIGLQLPQYKKSKSQNTAVIHSSYSRSSSNNMCQKLRFVVTYKSGNLINELKQIDSKVVFFSPHHSGEKYFSLPGLARVTLATGVVPVQEQLV